VPELIRYFTDLDLVDHLRTTLILASIGRVRFDVGKLRFSHLTLPRVIKYLQYHKSDQVPEITQWLTASHFRTVYKEAAILAFALRPDEFISQLVGIGRLTKADLICFSRAIQGVPVGTNTDFLSVFLIAQFQASTSRRKYVCALLRTIAVFIEHFSITSTEFYKPLTQVLVDNCSALFEPELAVCVSVICRHCPAFLKHPIVTQLADFPQLAAARVSLRLPTDMVGDLVPSALPSDVCRALRILGEMAQRQRHVKAVRSLISDTTARCAALCDLPSIAVIEVQFISKVIQANNELRSALFDRYFTDVWIAVSRAAFTTLARTLPLFLSVVEAGTSEYKALVRCCDSMVSQPSHFGVFRVYCDALRARLNDESSSADKAELTVRKLREYFAPSKAVDAFRAEKYLAEWTALLRQFVPLDRALRLMAKQYVRVGREMPVIAEVAKVAQEVRASSGPEAVAAALRGAKIENKAALAMILRGDPVRDIIDSLVQGETPHN
jgi:hypothetical protein